MHILRISWSRLSIDRIKSSIELPAYCKSCTLFEKIGAKLCFALGCAHLVKATMDRMQVKSDTRIVIEQQMNSPSDRYRAMKEGRSMAS